MVVNSGIVLLRNVTLIGKAFDEQGILNISYAMEDKINFKNKITDWWIK